MWRRPRPRRFRPGGRNDDYSTRQATLHSAGGHRRPSYPRKETFAQPSYPRRRVSSGPKRHSSRQQRLAASTSAHGAVIVAGRVPFSSTSDPVDSGSGAGMTTTLLGRRPQTAIIPAKGDLCTTVIPAQAGIQRSEAAFVPSTASRRLDVGARGGHCRRRGAIQLDLRPRRFRLGRWNDDYSTRQATLCSAGGHRRPSYPRRRESSGPKRHSSHQQRLAASTSARGAVIVAGRVPFSSTSHPVDSGSGAGMTTTLLSRLHSTRQAATDARHTRERRPLHNRHSRAGGNPAARSGIRPINSGTVTFEDWALTTYRFYW